jgi:hypothetical protein
MFELRRLGLVAYMRTRQYRMIISEFSGRKDIHFHASPEGERGFVIPGVDNAASDVFPYGSFSFPPL